MTPATRMSGEERRAQIVLVARDLFAEHGYKTTTADVARAAGVSEALIVKHFGSKENLFRATMVAPLIDLLEEALLAGRQRALADELGDPREHLRLLKEWGRAWTAFVVEHRALLLSLVRESAEFADDATQVLGLVRQLVDDVALMLEGHSQVDGYRPFSSRTATYATIGALTFGALMADVPDTYADEVCDQLFFGVLTTGARDAFER